MRNLDRITNKVHLGLGVVAVFASFRADPAAAQGESRMWKNSKGATLEAVWRGVEANNAIFTLKDGKTTQVPVSSLCKEDQQFMAARIASLVARAIGDDVAPTFSSLGSSAVSGEWPARIKVSAQKVEARTVSEDATGRIFIYESAHFRFTCHAQLSPETLGELAGNFEAVTEWMRLSPWGLLSNPSGPKYEVVLFEHLEDMSKIKADLPGIGAYYSAKERTLYSCFEQTGLKPVGDTWKMDGAFQPKMVLNQLTELLLHDIRAFAPPWLMIGLPLYMEHMPLRAGTLWTKQAQAAVAKALSIRSDLVPTDRLASMLTITINSWNKDSQFSPARTDSDGRNVVPQPTISNVLSTKPLTAIPLTAIPIAGPGRPALAEEKALSYDQIKNRSAFLIAYYYLVIEDAGKAETLGKLIKALAAEASAWQKYTADFTTYRTQMTQFTQQPGVQRLADGTIRFPSSLTPPQAPPPPREGESDDWTASHLKLLLGEKSPADMTKQIRAALTGAALLTEQ